MAKKKKCKEPANLAEEMAWIAEEFKDRIADNAEWARREEIHRKAEDDGFTVVPQSNDPLGDERVEFLIKW
jgi:hypothetical protein